MQLQCYFLGSLSRNGFAHATYASLEGNSEDITTTLWRKPSSLLPLSARQLAVSDTGSKSSPDFINGQASSCWRKQFLGYFCPSLLELLKVNMWHREHNCDYYSCSSTSIMFNKFWKKTHCALNQSRLCSSLIGNSHGMIRAVHWGLFKWSAVCMEREAGRIYASPTCHLSPCLEGMKKILFLTICIHFP